MSHRKRSQISQRNVKKESQKQVTATRHRKVPENESQMSHRKVPENGSQMSHRKVSEMGHRNESQQ